MGPASFSLELELEHGPQHEGDGMLALILSHARAPPTISLSLAHPT